MITLQDFAIRNNLKNEKLYLDVLEKIICPDFKNGPWVAGGSVRRLISGEDPLASDIDVFFANQSQLDDWLARVRTYHILSGEKRTHNITIRLALPWDAETSVTIQAIHIGFFSTAEEVIDSFDFTICQFATNGNRLAVGKLSLYDLARKRLVINRLTYATDSLRRLVKYTKQGFWACSGTMSTFLNIVVQNPSLIRDDIISID